MAEIGIVQDPDGGAEPHNLQVVPANQGQGNNLDQVEVPGYAFGILPLPGNVPLLAVNQPNLGQYVESVFVPMPVDDWKPGFFLHPEVHAPEIAGHIVYSLFVYSDIPGVITPYTQPGLTDEGVFFKTTTILDANFDNVTLYHMTFDKFGFHINVSVDGDGAEMRLALMPNSTLRLYCIEEAGDQKFLIPVEPEDWNVVTLEMSNVATVVEVFEI